MNNYELIDKELERLHKKLSEDQYGSMNIKILEMIKNLHELLCSAIYTPIQQGDIPVIPAISPQPFITPNTVPNSPAYAPSIQPYCSPQYQTFCGANGNVQFPIGAIPMTSGYTTTLTNENGANVGVQPEKDRNVA